MQVTSAWLFMVGCQWDVHILCEQFDAQRFDLWKCWVYPAAGELGGTCTWISYRVWACRQHHLVMSDLTPGGVIGPSAHCSAEALGWILESVELCVLMWPGPAAWCLPLELLSWRSYIGSGTNSVKTTWSISASCWVALSGCIREVLYGNFKILWKSGLGSPS